MLPLHNDRADLALGSRLLRELPPHARLGNWLAARLMRKLYNLQVTDLGPFRAIRRELLAELAVKEMTYGWPTEMMVKTARRGARVVERPVSYHPRLAGKSKVSGTLRGTVLATVYILGITLRYAILK